MREEKDRGQFRRQGAGEALEDPVSTTTTMVAAGVLKDFEKGSTRRRPWNSSAGSSVPREKASEIVSERGGRHTIEGLTRSAGNIWLLPLTEFRILFYYFLGQ